ncbi:hypothetical protein I6N96_06320 [Enterococcus sp. BWM-S5]|uniref:Transmembrane protein n=1 Tax=Enterococcus larvae TaxID=2794352 RepID=A0ABS4CHJ5_9ENTE|nr:hypothetical protein [Enterococcus larvae]MBP1045890.1 hypothetical protein [Enterococcus larvae]
MKVRNFVNSLSRYISPAWLAVLIVGIPAILLLFVPPINGLADNGDYFMILNSNDLYIQNPDNYQYNSYFQNIYGIRQFYNETTTGFLSTGQLFITVAIWLNKLFFSSSLFDLRFLGLVYLAALLPAIYLLTRALTFGMKKSRGYISAVILGFMFGDGMYIIYFNSFYPEAAAYIGLLYFAAVLFYFFRVKTSVYGFSICMLVSVLVFIGAYRQFLFLIIGVVIAAAGLLTYLSNRTQQLTLIATVLGLTGMFVTLYALTPDITYDRDVYHSVNRGLNLNADSPEEILAEGDVNPQYSLLRGTSYYDEFSPVPLSSETLKADLINQTNYLWITASYLLNPQELSKLLTLGVQDMYLVKPNELGNYLEKDSREAGQKTHFFALFSQIKAAAFPKNFGFFLLLAAVILFVYGIGFYQGLRKKERWLCFRFFIILGLFVNFFMTFIVAVIYTGDADFTRHLFLTSVYFDLILLIFITDMLGGRFWSDERRSVE